jgi:hypothetical protein
MPYNTLHVVYLDALQKHERQFLEYFVLIINHLNTLAQRSNQKVWNFFCNGSVGVLSRHNNNPQADVVILTEDGV